MEKYTRTRIKELNQFSVGGNVIAGEYFLTLFNNDENGNETDTVVINLSRDRIASLITCLQAIQKPKAFRPRTFSPKTFP